VIWAMYFVPAPDDLPAGEGEAAASQVTLAGLNSAVVTKLTAVGTPLAIGAGIALALALLGTFGLGIFPAPLISLARQAAGLP
jgi:hypothetical protein